MGSDVKKMSILGHLAVLRKSLLRSVIAVLVTTTISVIFYEKILNVLIQPAQGIFLIFTEPTEMIGTVMRVGIFAGVILASPYIIYEVVMFVLPALTRKEKTYIYVILPWVILMFVCGVIFAYFVLLPPALSFLLNFGSNIATPQIKIGSYISLVTRLMLAVGLVFEMPVLLTFLARLGIVSPKWLAGKRKIAIVFAFVLAAIITPTFDFVNQSLVAVPLVILYEMSIWLAKLVYKRERRVAVPLTATPDRET